MEFHDSRPLHPYPLRDELQEVKMIVSNTDTMAVVKIVFFMLVVFSFNEYY